MTGVYRGTAMQSVNHHPSVLGTNKPKLTPLPDQYRFKVLKIQVCSFWAKGRCTRGDECTFAHGNVELRLRPDMKKTKLCPAYERGQCMLKVEDCPYAHGESDLKFGKQALCTLFRHGKCGLGESCRFAHDYQEVSTSFVPEEQKNTNNKDWSDGESSSDFDVKNKFLVSQSTNNAASSSSVGGGETGTYKMREKKNKYNYDTSYPHENKGSSSTYFSQFSPNGKTQLYIKNKKAPPLFNTEQGDRLLNFDSGKHKQIHHYYNKVNSSSTTAINTDDNIKCNNNNMDYIQRQRMNVFNTTNNNDCMSPSSILNDFDCTPPWRKTRETCFNSSSQIANCKREPICEIKWKPKPQQDRTNLNYDDDKSEDAPSEDATGEGIRSSSSSPGSTYSERTISSTPPTILTPPTKIISTKRTNEHNSPLAKHENNNVGQKTEKRYTESKHQMSTEENGEQMEVATTRDRDELDGCCTNEGGFGEGKTKNEKQKLFHHTSTTLLSPLLPEARKAKNETKNCNSCQNTNFDDSLCFFCDNNMNSTDYYSENSNEYVDDKASDEQVYDQTNNVYAEEKISGLQNEQDNEVNCKYPPHLSNYSSPSPSNSSEKLQTQDDACNYSDSSSSNNISDMQSSDSMVKMPNDQPQTVMVEDNMVAELESINYNISHQQDIATQNQLIYNEQRSREIQQQLYYYQNYNYYYSRLLASLQELSLKLYFQQQSVNNNYTTNNNHYTLAAQKAAESAAELMIKNPLFDSTSVIKMMALSDCMQNQRQLDHQLFCNGCPPTYPHPSMLLAPPQFTQPPCATPMHNSSLFNTQNPHQRNYIQEITELNKLHNIQNILLDYAQRQKNYKD